MDNWDKKRLDKKPDYQPWYDFLWNKFYSEAIYDKDKLTIDSNQFNTMRECFIYGQFWMFKLIYVEQHEYTKEQQIELQERMSKEFDDYINKKINEQRK